MSTQHRHADWLFGLALFIKLLVSLAVIAIMLSGCGQMYEQSGLIRWPDGTCLWPCIGGGGLGSGGSTVYGQSYTWQGVTYYEFYE